MPYLTTSDASRVVDYARDTICDLLRDALNGDDWQEVLGKPIWVTPYQAQAATHYEAQEACVFVLAGPQAKPEEWTDSSTRTRHHELAFTLDMCMSASDDEADSAGGEAIADHVLVGAVDEIVRASYAAFDALCLGEVQYSAGAENQVGEGLRNPHTLTCMVGTQQEI